MFLTVNYLQPEFRDVHRDRCAQGQINNLEFWICFHVPQQTSGGRRREKVSLEGPARLASPLHLSGWRVGGQMLKCPWLHLVVQSEESTYQMEPIQRRRLSWTSQRSRRSPAAQLFITNSGVRGLFFEEEEEEGGLARSGWTWQPARQWQEGGGRYLLPAVLRVRLEEPFALWPQREKGKTGSTRWWRKRRMRRRSCGGGVKLGGVEQWDAVVCFFFGGGTGESLLLLRSHSSVKKTIQLISLMSSHSFDKLCFSCFWFPVSVILGSQNQNNRDHSCSAC